MLNNNPEFDRILLGPLQTNCYLVVCPDSRAAIVIDPADQADKILKAAQKKTAHIEQILLTHMHPDHLGALPALREATGAKVLGHRLDVDLLNSSARFFGIRTEQIPSLIPDILLDGGETITVGHLTGTIIHTPGHTPGSVCLQMGHNLFTGDTLFCQGIGRVDLPGGNLDNIVASIQKLFELPDETAVYPGHGPSTTNGAEKRDNPYV